ncbi:zinc finger protein on ecdysone puffs [Coccinella septempunctata]|uniref:zinc finger protein on ecdysone puffs n=1 Tax=Coccinella septempunctata TaxID=41139 RepID=UPI001D0951B9|nr:zinc finger protein on ecdysone puffs [Coccinella septempunctata]
MANRRLMGMGNRSGNRSFSQQPFQGNVNPWQGNMSNDMNQGFMNQLSNPQQLALALSSLLQPQQQPMNNPPSLLSLNAAPAYNQDRDLGRFGNRGRSDFRRPEPYNKNNRGGGWRDQGRNRNRNQNRNKTSTPKKVEEKKKEEKKPNDSIDLSTEEGEDEKKRDWKEEKNKTEDTQDQEMKDDSAVDDDAKKNKDKEGKYCGIPQHLLHCFVCSKDMWDGESFQKHVRGRAHKQMLDSLEESMSITVGILRENMRLAEEKKLIELNRMQRLNKKPSRKFSDVESHCNMCDFKFLGKIMAHRKSEGHQRLKRFLHPNCNMCSKEFPSRMEWVEHRLSPEHLRELAKFMEENNKADGAVVVKEDESEFDLEPLMEEVTEQEDDFPILEMDDDLHDLQNRIPAYRKTRLLGSKSLIPFTGFMCQVCNTTFVSEEFSQNHLKSKKHYLKFVEAVKNKYQKQLQEEKEKEKVEKEKKEEESEVKKEDEGEEEGDADGEEEAEDGNEENTENSQDAIESEMYDPEEACTEEAEKDKEDSKQNGDDDAPAAVEVKEEKEEEVKEQNTSVSEEKPKPAGQPTTPRPKRQVATNVKNGAGPKSKKAKK